MAIRKVESFAAKDTKLAELAKALSHPARIAILRALAEHNMCICGDIVDVLPLAQSTVSQHLKALKNAGLISGESEGARSCYCVDRERLNEFAEWIQDLFSELNQECCP